MFTFLLWLILLVLCWPLALLALVLYNRRGAEGELKRIEGDVTTWFETIPDIIRLQLRPFRRARAVSWLPPESV